MSYSWSGIIKMLGGYVLGMVAAGLVLLAPFATPSVRAEEPDMGALIISSLQTVSDTRTEYLNAKAKRDFARLVPAGMRVKVTLDYVVWEHASEDGVKVKILSEILPCASSGVLDNVKHKFEEEVIVGTGGALVRDAPRFKGFHEVGPPSMGAATNPVYERAAWMSYLRSMDTWRKANAVTMGPAQESKIELVVDAKWLQDVIDADKRLRAAILAKPDAKAVKAQQLTHDVVVRALGPAVEVLTTKAPDKEKVGGVRMDYDAQMLLQILAAGDASETAKRLAELADRLNRAKDAGESRKIVAAFLEETTTRFRAGQKLTSVDGLVAVSLKDLVTAAERYATKWDRLPAELRNPGNLTRIHGFVASEDDIVIIGRQETGVAKLELDDLVVGIRTVWKRNETPMVSLDPDPANVEGDPRVRVLGVPGDSGFALTMLEADYAMKKIMAGVDAVDVAGYRTLKETLRESRKTFMSRFWLYPIQPATGEIQMSADGKTALFAGDYQCLSEEMLNLKDGLVGTGEAYGPAAEAADSFSQHLAEISDKRPVFRRLQGLFDVVLLGRIWHVQGRESPLLDRLCALPYRTVKIKETYPAVTVMIRKDGDSLFYLRGGVQAKVGAGRRSWLATGDDVLAGVEKRSAVLAGSGQMTEAMQGVSLRVAAPTLRKDSSSRDYTAAAQRMHAGDLKGAMEAADRLIVADPWDSEALVLRALVHLRRSDYRQAEADALRARDCDPDDRDAAAAAGQVLFECAWLQGRPDDALREMDAALKFDLQSAGGQLQRGQALAMLDKPDEARKAFGKALELDPANALACARMAMLELSQPDQGVLAAKPWVIRAKALDANLPEVQLVDAQWQQFAEIRPDLAQQIAQKLWDKKSNGPGIRLQALVILASVAASREKWNDVDKYVAKMEELNSGAPEVYIVAATIARTWGEKLRAVAYLEKAEKLAPNHPLVIKLRGRVNR